MTKEHFLNLAAFNMWANKKICDFISANLDETLSGREIVSSFSSVKKTVYHLWDAETIWLERLHGNSLRDGPGKNFTGTLQNGLANFLGNSKALREFLSEQTEDFFAGSITFTHRSGKVYTQEINAVLTHVMNHSTFHRGQLITMFRQLGFVEDIPKTDFIEYYREKKELQ